MEIIIRKSQKEKEEKGTCQSIVPYTPRDFSGNGYF
jgi:hypothetical protein